MCNKPLVSILIPVYNREKMIIDALESSIKQTYENIEIIVVDNCSTDSTYAVALEYMKRDKRIKLYRNESNIGMIKNWQKCLDYASGDYIHLLCSDDILNENFIKKCVDILESDKEADFAYTNIQFFHEINEIDNEVFNNNISKVNKLDYLKETFSEKNNLCQAGHVFRRENFFIEQNIENAMGYNEFAGGIDSLVPLNAINNHCYYIDNKLYYNRLHEGSITIYTDQTLLKSQYTIAWLYYLRKKNIYDEALYSLIFNRLLRVELENFKMQMERNYALNACENKLFNKEYYGKFNLKQKSIIDRIFKDCKNGNIGIYGTGRHTANLINIYKDIYGELDFKLFFIDSYFDKTGSEFMGNKVYGYQDINNLNLDKIIISSYMYQDEIYNKLVKSNLKNVDLVKIYGENDVRIF